MNLDGQFVHNCKASLYLVLKQGSNFQMIYGEKMEVGGSLMVRRGPTMVSQRLSWGYTGFFRSKAS